MPSPNVHKISPDYPDPDLIRAAGEVLNQGGVIAFPTRCLYGMGADAFKPEAVERIFRIKRRSSQNPILILIDDPARLRNLTARITASAGLIADRFWPGKVTLVFEASNLIPDYLTAGTGKIGIRLAGHPVAAALAGAIRGPITGTSANVSGQPGCHRINDLPPAVAHRLDLILDAGPLEGGRGSTVVDVSGDDPRVLREGVVLEKEILAAAGGI